MPVNVLRILFWLTLATWTVLLVRPVPQDITAELQEWSDLLPWLISKTLHITAYTGFSVGALALFGRWRWWVFGGVAVHAILGELGQHFGNLWYDTRRIGSVRDVFIDWLGMAIGFGIGWAGRKVLASRRV
ncbi:MAG: hypothetical protein MUF18_09790 [Fimbriiglobus sp.]|jgi:hypothetical protein|nr:hypothetical protein [Fimbriiglobus sp.]